MHLNVWNKKKMTFFVVVVKNSHNVVNVNNFIYPVDNFFSFFFFHFLSCVSRWFRIETRHEIKWIYKLSTFFSFVFHLSIWFCLLFNVFIHQKKKKKNRRISLLCKKKSLNCRNFLTVSLTLNSIADQKRNIF